MSDDEMTREEALDILRTASWSYRRILVPGNPPQFIPAAVTGYPGINDEILRIAGIDVSGENGNGIAILNGASSASPTLSKGHRPVGDLTIPPEEIDEEEEMSTQYAVFGKKNILYMNDHDIEYGQSRKGLNLPDVEEGGGIFNL